MDKGELGGASPRFSFPRLPRPLVYISLTENPGTVSGVISRYQWAASEPKDHNRLHWKPEDPVSMLTL